MTSLEIIIIISNIYRKFRRVSYRIKVVVVVDLEVSVYSEKASKGSNNNNNLFDKILTPSLCRLFSSFAAPYGGNVLMNERTCGYRYR